MILWNSASFALAGALLTFATVGSTDASAGDAAPLPAGRCAVLGPGFAEVGDGVCGRVGGQRVDSQRVDSQRVDSHVRVDTHVRVDMGPSHAALNTWSAPQGTSTAGMRTDGAGMVPGAGAMQHLRVRNGLDTYDPFR